MKATTTAMRAIAIEKFGAQEEVKVMHLTPPPLQEEDVQISIKYAGVNPVDWKIKDGLLKERMPSEFPIVLGMDCAGVITAIGKNIKNFKIGDEVFTFCKKSKMQWGTYAEFLRVDAQQVAIKPKKLNFAEAAALPLSALTAWQALFDHGKLKKGGTVLIHAGAGGVGTMAIQFAKSIGAFVITTASKAHHSYVKKCGADLIIDYSKESFVKKITQEFPTGIDLVIDSMGGEVCTESMRVIKERGCLVSLLQQFDDKKAQPNDIRCVFFLTKPDGSQLQKIAELIDKGTIFAPQIEELPLESAQIALEKVRAGHVIGKIVLKVQ